jgi:hypothetical protein
MKFLNMKTLFAALAFSVLAFTAMPPGAWADTVAPPTDTSAAGELAFWNSIKASDNADDYFIYLRSFPDGMFQDVAKARYEELGGGEKFVPAPEPVVVEEQPPEPKVTAPPKRYKKPVYVTAKPKYSKSIFAKPKKPRHVIVYRKAYVKVKKPKRNSAVIIYQKPKVRRYVKVRATQPYVKVKPKKIYIPANEPSSGGSGGGGDGGGGGGGGGGSGGGGWGG